MSTDVLQLLIIAGSMAVGMVLSGVMVLCGSALTGLLVLKARTPTGEALFNRPWGDAIPDNSSMDIMEDRLGEDGGGMMNWLLDRVKPTGHSRAEETAFAASSEHANEQMNRRREHARRAAEAMEQAADQTQPGHVDKGPTTPESAGVAP